MVGGKWVIFWALVSFVCSASGLAENHGFLASPEGRALRNCHRGRPHPTAGPILYGTPDGVGHSNPYGGFGTQFPSQGFGTQFPSGFGSGTPDYNSLLNPANNRYLAGLYNPNSNPYLGCATYLPISNYSGYPNYSFGYWSPSNGGYGVNYTQPGLYKSYQYGPYNYGVGYPSTIYGPYSSGTYPGYGSGYPSLVSGNPGYGLGYSLNPQAGYGFPVAGSPCQLLCATRAGF